MYRVPISYRVLRWCGGVFMRTLQAPIPWSPNDLQRDGQLQEIQMALALRS